VTLSYRDTADDKPAVEYIGNGYRLHRDRARLLAEIENLPAQALISARHAAALIGTSPGQMANWRLQRRGPPFFRSRRFIRYRIADLQTYMASRLQTTEETT
jgi:hypothetical protein